MDIVGVISIVILGALPYVAFIWTERLYRDYHADIVAIHVKYVDEMLASINKVIEAGYPDIAQSSIEHMREYVARWPEQAKKR
jgi:hypothetical protein